MSSQRLDMLSPFAERADVRADISIGFPYRQSHAALLASLIAESLAPLPAKKGLVTDLDDTVWLGILGDVGVDGISCSLEGGAQAHAIYQRLLASLAASGVLVAIASKNDPELVTQALARDDHLVRADQFFPVQAHWHPKSQSMEAILRAWNVGADSVVFVDDSPLELAEVKSRFPDVECLLFPKGDAAAVVQLVSQLRDLFGKQWLQDEDRLRLDSLRAADRLREQLPTDATTAGDFLATTGAELDLEFSRDASDTRALELVNKTNQFNLNGARLTEREWHALLNGPGTMLTATYSDKFGKLGKIAVLTAQPEGNDVRIDSWVMSCRAFSRHIEFQCLRAVFDHFDASRLVLNFAPTSRNGPLQDLLRTFFEDEPFPTPLILARETFESKCPSLHHVVRIKHGALNA